MESPVTLCFFEHISKGQVHKLLLISDSPVSLSFTHLTDLSLLLSTVALLLFPLLLQLFPLNLQLCVLHLQLPDLTLQLCHLLSPLSDLHLGLLQGGLCP